MADSMVLDFVLLAGENYRSSLTGWQTSTSFASTSMSKFAVSSLNTFGITGVQLEKSSVATPFDVRPFDWQQQLQQAAMGVIGFTNLVSNGDFAVDSSEPAGTAQRVTLPGTLPVSLGLGDFFLGGTGIPAGALDIKQQTNGVLNTDLNLPPSLRTMASVTCAAAAIQQNVNMGVTLAQSIPSSKFADLRWGTEAAQPPELSFWVRATFTGKFTASLRHVSVPRSYVMLYRIDTASMWQRVSFIVPADIDPLWSSSTTVTDAQADWAVLDFTLIDGGRGNIFATPTPFKWAAGDFFTENGGDINICSATSNAFYISNIQLARSSTASTFAVRPNDMLYNLLLRGTRRSRDLCHRTQARMPSATHERTKCVV
jgi:hypothetical protein